MKTNRFILLGLLSLTLLFSSCDKDEVIETPPTTAEVVISTINQIKPKTIRIIKGDKYFDYDNYTIKDGCWLCIEEIIDPQTESVRYTRWNLNNVCQYHYYEYEEMYSLYLEFN